MSLRESARSTMKNLGETAKSAFVNAYFGGFKKKITIALVIVLVFIIFCTVLITCILNPDLDLGIFEEKNYSVDTDGSMMTFGNDYVVNTAISDPKLIITDRQVLINAINSLNIAQRGKENLISQVDTFLEVQQTYHVNAVFSAAVPIIESGAGTDWDLIDQSTYNWISIKGKYGGGYIDRNGTSWNRYTGYDEAVKYFANLISNGPYYFTAGKNTVMSIAPTYCDDYWGKCIIDRMTEMYNAVGIDASGIEATGNDIVDTAAQLFMQMYVENWGYNIPNRGNSGYCADDYSGGRHYHKMLTDCSDFVSRVLRKLGYNIDLNSKGFRDFDPVAYGLQGRCEVIKYNYRAINPNDLRPGDILAYDGHVQIIAKVQDGHTYVYDAGTESRWVKSKGQMLVYDFYKNATTNTMTVLRFH